MDDIQKKKLSMLQQNDFENIDAGLDELIQKAATITQRRNDTGQIFTGNDYQLLCELMTTKAKVNTVKNLLLSRENL